MTSLTLDDCRHLPGSVRHQDRIESTCPLCSHLREPRNQHKTVCTFFFRGGIPVSFNCHHCGKHGPIIDRAAARRQRRTTSFRGENRSAYKMPTEPAQARTARAISIFADAVEVAGSPAARYLRERGLHFDAFPEDLRFHSACPFEQDRLPCMIAQVRDIMTDKPIAIHRTAIKPDGNGKYFSDDRKSRLSLAPINGGVVKLTPNDAITMGLGIAEGIETALSCMSIGWPTWSCLSAAGIAKFPVLAGIEALTIFCDHDHSAAGEKAAIECGVRWRDAGREVKIIRPKNVGTDWNDVLKVAGNGN